MKLKSILAIIFVFVLIICSCAENVPETDDNASDRTEISEETNMPEQDVKEVVNIPVYVSPLAKENFLLPLENYSWEQEYTPEYVVVHFTSAVVLSRDDPYNAEKVRGIFEDNEISIHYIIDRTGSVECYIPENRAAWHAGRGEFAKDERLTNAMNKYSIGIEILAIGSEKDMAQYLTKEEYTSLDKNLIGFTEAQYESLKALVSDICLRNGIPFDRQHVIGHSEYNSAKSDPGEFFEWDRIFGE